MDQIFADCVDVVSLAGTDGIAFGEVTNRVLDTPRPALVKWLFKNFKKREPHFFQIAGTDCFTAVVVASKALRERALGYTPLEHAPLQPNAWAILEAVGQAGKTGYLQSQLSKDLKIKPVNLHHYLGSLLSLNLVVRRKIVLSTQRKKDGSGRRKKKRPSVNHVTQTCIIALARYAREISAGNAPVLPTGAKVLDEGQSHETVVHNLYLEERTTKILELLNDAPGGIMPERDIKIQIIEDTDIRNRHRSFRTVRDKMVKAKLVKKCMRRCIDMNGRPRGQLPCLLLYDVDEMGSVEDEAAQIITGTEEDGNFEGDDGEDELEGLNKAPLTSLQARQKAGLSAEMLCEVDIAEQVYRTFDKSKERGLSCPEIVSLLDGDTGDLGIEYKRMRSLLNIMEKSHDLKTVQHFHSSACHKRFVLKEHHKEEGNDWPPEVDTVVSKAAGNSKSRPMGRGRTVSGNLTTLGTRRRAILQAALEAERVILVEKIGKVISAAEGHIVHVDVKVSRKIVNSMINDKICKYVTVGKPRFGGMPSKDRSTMQLLVLWDIPQNGKEIRDFLSRYAKRDMATPEMRSLLENPAAVKNSSKKRKRKNTDDEVEKKRSVRLRNLKRTKSRNSDVSEVEAVPTPNAVIVHDAHRAGIDGDAETESEEDEVSEVKENKSPSNEEALPDIVVVNAGRGAPDQRKIRLSRLRALDYGFIAPKMRRAQLLHEYLVRLVMDDEFIHLEIPVRQRTMEVAGQTEDLGTFVWDDVLRNMSVGLFANLFGIGGDHGELSEEVKCTEMKMASPEIQWELQERSSGDQAKLCLSILWDLGLVSSVSNTKWFIRGAGVYRDFGQGLPLGSNAHSIVFDSFKAVRSFWNELNILSNPPAIVANYVRDPQSSILFAETVLKLDLEETGADPPKQNRIYYPYSWVPTRRGSVVTLVEDEFTMEMLLQKIIVGWENDQRMPKDTSTWLQGPIPWIPVEVLFDNRNLLDHGYRRRRVRKVQMCDVEYLIQYARKRTRYCVSEDVIRLSKKPNNNVSDYKWLKRTDPYRLVRTRRMRNRSGIRKRKSKQSTIGKGKHSPGRAKSSRKHTNENEKPNSLLVFEECVTSLTMSVKVNALLHHWKEKDPDIRMEERREFLLKMAANLLEQDREVFESFTEELRDNDFVARYLKVSEDCILHEMKEMTISVDGDGQLSEVPDKLGDESYGDVLTLPEIIRAILSGCKLHFEKIQRKDRTFSLAKRKRILRWLRSYLTGSSGAAHVPNPSSEAKVYTKKARNRLLASKDRPGDLQYGLIKVDDIDLDWLANSRTNACSGARRIILKDIVTSILAQSDESFDFRAALFVLSRFTEASIIEVRNELYDRKHISLRKKDDQSQRPFWVDPAVKNQSLVHVSNEAHRIAASAEQNIEAFSGSNEVIIKALHQSLLQQISDTSKGSISQGSLIAVTQKFCFPSAASSNGCELELFPRVDNSGTQLTVEISTRKTEENENEVESDGLEGTVEESEKETGTRAIGKFNGNILDECEEDKKVDGGVVKADRVRLREEWEKEMNERLLRELKRVDVYKSGEEVEFAAILGWIIGSGVEGVTSYEIHGRSKEENFSDVKVVQVIATLLKDGIIHRFGYGVGNRDNDSEGRRACAIYMAGSFAWTYAVAPKLTTVSNNSADKDGDGGFWVDWKRAKPMSAWMEISGEYNTKLIEDVQVSVLNVIAKRPGMHEKDVVQAVLGRIPLVSERSILDTMHVLLKAGRISRKVVEQIDTKTIFNHRSRTAIVAENRMTEFVDGIELAGLGGKIGFRYSVGGTSLGKLVGAEEMENVGIVP